MKKLLILVLILFPPLSILAHELQTGFLNISMNQDGESAIISWKQPRIGEKIIPVSPVITGFDLNPNFAHTTISSGALQREWVLDLIDNPLEGAKVIIDGLEFTTMDAIVRYTDERGSVTTVVLNPQKNSMVIGDTPGTGEAILNYTRLGVEHIMLGIDHLLFVLGLLLLSKTRRLLIRTITSFTVGHSISLALAALGMLSVPDKPLGAVIALSIVFLALELVRDMRGEISLTIRQPWIVSFVFGIVHGLGFAGGLTALGLPKIEIPLALLFFNIGVEIGQLAFIFLVLGLIVSWKRMEIKMPNWGRPIPAYGIGAFAAYWFIGRLVLMF